MGTVTLHQSNACPTRSPISRRRDFARRLDMTNNRWPNAWQVGVSGLLVLSVLVNAAMTARIAGLESRRQADAAQYQEQIEEAERVRDLAVRELGAMAPCSRQRSGRPGRPRRRPMRPPVFTRMSATAP